jgi:hypothetical protein
MSKALSQELRENCVYLREGGWRNTAILMQLAADELDRLEARVKELEKMQADPQSVQALVRSVASRRKPVRIRGGKS